jgi:hypothetical protein
VAEMPGTSSLRRDTTTPFQGPPTELFGPTQEILDKVNYFAEYEEAGVPR